MTTTYGEQKTVLVLHGTEPLGTFLMSFFKGMPVSVAGVSTQPDARRLFNLLRPQLVVVDLNREWFPLLEAFRSEEPSLEVIALTNSDELAEEARRAGFDNVLVTDESPGNLADGIQSFGGDWLSTPYPEDATSILVIDDETESLDALSNSLRARGFRVIPARSGQMALDILESDSSISVVVLDLVLPEMGGIETLKKLKRQNKNLGFIMMSTFADREIVSQALNLGAFDFILKPVDVGQLEGSILACSAHLEYRRRPWWKRLTSRAF